MTSGWSIRTDHALQRYTHRRTAGKPDGNIDFKSRLLTCTVLKQKAAHRILPLHKDIDARLYVAARMHGKYLIETENGQPIIYDTYKNVFNLLMSTLKIDISPMTVVIPLSAVWTHAGSAAPAALF